MDNKQHLATSYKTHKFKLDWFLIILIFTSIAIGIYELILAQSYYSEVGFNSKLLILQFIFLGFGIMFFLILLVIDYKKIEKYSRHIYVIGVIILAMPLLNNEIGPCIRVFNINFQPAVLATPLLIVSYVGFIKKYCNESISKYIILPLTTLLPCLIIYFINGSLLRTLIMLVIYIVIFTIYILSEHFAGNRKKVLVTLYSIISCITLLAITIFLLEPSRRQWICCILNPELDPIDIGYHGHIIRSILKHAKIIGCSEFVGEGFLLVPLSTHVLTFDYTFLFIIESLGLFIAFCCLLILCLFIIRCILNTREIKDLYGKLVASGLTTLLLLEITYNIFMNLSGVAANSYLPFFSLSTPNIVVDLGIIGYLLNIFRKK